MSCTEFLPQIERMLWKIRLCESGYWRCLGTAKARTPLSDLEVRNGIVSWTMIWALKTNTKLVPGPFFKTTWNIMYQSNWKLSWGKTFCFFAKQIHCSLTGKSLQEHFSVWLLPEFVTFPECAVKMKNVTNKSATEIQEHENWLVWQGGWGVCSLPPPIFFF